MTWTGFEMWICFCDICVCMVVYLAKLSKMHFDITYIFQWFLNIAPSPQLFEMNNQVVMEALGLLMSFYCTYPLLHYGVLSLGD